MQNPLLRDIRRICAQRSKELKRDFERAVAEPNEPFHKLCDVVISPTGERRFVASGEKMYDALVAPRLPQK